MGTSSLPEWFERYVASAAASVAATAGTAAATEAAGTVNQEDAHDLERIRALLETEVDPYDRRLELHLTGSAVILHLPTNEVLLRWHERQQAWLQVGGHGDAGESNPLDVALREAEEETGLEDLRPWPPASEPDSTPPVPIHVVIVAVAPRGEEPAHEHADLRYVLTTTSPERIRAENPSARLRWARLPDAVRTVEPNLAGTLRRIRQ